MGIRLSSERIKSTVGGRFGRIDRLGLTGACAQVVARTATGAAPKRLAGLGFELAKIAVGKSSVTPESRDWRFKNKAWEQNPALRRLCQTYLAWSQTTNDLVDDAHLDWRTEERAKLATGLLTSALAPTNNPLLNPDALERAFQTKGRSIASGIGNISKDITTNKGLPRSSDGETYVVGGNLAVTPGSVVYRSEVLELIQYKPSTDTVFETPMVLVPPQINKYYFMDMAPGRSFVEYAVSQGIQMFVISWRNPTNEHRHWTLDTYVEGVEGAVRAACEIAGTDRANTVSLCAGGITTAALLAHLAATRQPLIDCATFAVTLLDFSVPTMIGMFGSPSVVRNSMRSSRKSGTIGGADTKWLFAMLRPNDLIWNYWVRNNLLGERPAPFDVLAWNADSTRLPAGLHEDFLQIFLHNSLASGDFKVFGSRVDLAEVENDTFVMAAKNDHLTAWRACYAATQLFGGKSEFVLSSSGHIQSLVNPPGNPKMTVTTGPTPGPDPDQWLAEATSHTGSWWESWAAWASVRSGARRPAPTSLGCARHPAEQAAPGTYVHAR